MCDQLELRLILIVGYEPVVDVEAEEEGRENDNAKRVENPRMLQNPHKFCLKQERNYFLHRNIKVLVRLFILSLP